MAQEMDIKEEKIEGVPYLIPTFTDNGKTLIFNLNKCQIAEIENSDKLSSKIEMLNNHNFFDSSYSFTPDKKQIEIVLSTTMNCNMRCKYCFLGESSHSKLDAKIAIKFISEILNSSKDAENAEKIHISFFGGEPTLNFTLIKSVVAYINDIKKNDNRKYYFAITSNGTMNDDVLSFLIENDFHFSISMDGIPEIQDYQRPLKNGEKSSQLVEKNIKKILTSGKLLRVRLTVTDLSVKTMPTSTVYLSELGVKYIHYECVNIAGRALDISAKMSNIKRPAPDLFVSMLLMSSDIAKKYSVSIINPSIMLIFYPSLWKCDGMSGKRIVISPTGMISRCLEVQSPSHPLADIMQAGNFNKNTFNIHLSKDRESHIEENKTGICQKCYCKFICSNGCPSRNYHSMNSPTVVDTFHCMTTKPIIDHVLKRMWEETSGKGLYRKNEYAKLWHIVTPKEFCITPNLNTMPVSNKKYFSTSLNLS